MASIGLALAEGRRLADTEKSRKRQMEVEEAQSKVILDQAKNYFSELETNIRQLEREARASAAKATTIESRNKVAELEAAQQGKAVFNKYLDAIENGDEKSIAAALTELMPGTTWRVDPNDTDGFENGLDLINVETGMTKTYVDPVEAVYDIGSLAMGPEGRRNRAQGIIGARIEASKENKKFEQKIREMREQMRIDLIKMQSETLKDPGKIYDAMFKMAANEEGWSVDKDGNLFKADPEDPTLQIFASPSEVSSVANITEKYLGKATDLSGRANPLAAAFAVRKQEAIERAKNVPAPAPKPTKTQAAPTVGEALFGGLKPTPQDTTREQRRAAGIEARRQAAPARAAGSPQGAMFYLGTQPQAAPATPAPSAPGLGTITTEQFFRSLPAMEQQELRYDAKTDSIRDRVTDEVVNREDLLPAQ